MRQETDLYGKADTAVFRNPVTDTHTCARQQQPIMFAAHRLALRQAPLTGIEVCMSAFRKLYGSALFFLSANNRQQPASGFAPSRHGCLRSGWPRLGRVLPLLLLVCAAIQPGAPAQSTAPPIILNAPGEVQAQLIVSKGPKVNVLHTDFAGGADPTGVSDSTAAFQAALAYAQTKAGNASGAGAATLYIPAGRYKMNGCLTITGANAAVNILGDGSSNTEIDQTAASGCTVQYLNTNGGAPFSTVFVKGINLWGSGHNTTASLLDIVDMQFWVLDDVRLGNTGGVALNINGNSERGAAYNLSISQSRRAINANGNINEVYFNNTLAYGNGADNGGYSWNVNALNGSLPAAHTATPVAPTWTAATTFGLGTIINDSTTACGNNTQACNWQVTATASANSAQLCTTGAGVPAWTAKDGNLVIDGSCQWTNISDRSIIRPDYHAAITWLNGQNVHFIGGSYKSTVNMGAFQFIGTDHFSTSHSYCEASGLPSINPCVQVGGTPWVAHGQTAMPATLTDQTITLDGNGIYSPMYFTNLAALQAGQAAVRNWAIEIMPSDYLKGSTAPSAICAGVPGCTITRGTVESAALAGTYNATPSGSTSALINRLPGLTASPNPQYAWPASGYIITIPMNAVAPSASGTSQQDHFNGMDGVAAGYAVSCSLTQLTANPALGSPANTCGTVLNGAVYDGWSAQTPANGYGALPYGNQGYQSNAFYSMNDTVVYTNTSGTQGQSNEGAVVTSLSGYVTFNSAGCVEQAAAPPPAASVKTNYNNGSCVALMSQYPDGSSASIRLRDTGADTTLDSVQAVYKTDFSQTGIIGPYFSGKYRIGDLGNNLQVVLVGAPNPYPQLELDNAGANQWQAQKSGTGAINIDHWQGNEEVHNGFLKTDGNFIPMNNIAWVQDAYMTAANVAEVSGVAYAQWDPAAAGTFTLPPLATRGYFTLLVPSGNAQVKTIKTGTGSIFAKGASVGNTWTWPNGYPGAITFYSDGSNWQITTQMGVSKTCSTYPTVVAGVVTSC